MSSFFFLPSSRAWSAASSCRFSSFKGTTKSFVSFFFLPFSRRFLPFHDVALEITTNTKEKEKKASWTSQKSSHSIQGDMIINIFFAVPFFSGKEQKLCRETFSLFAFNLTHKSTKVYLDANIKRKRRERWWGEKICRCQLQSFTIIMTFCLSTKFVEKFLENFFLFISKTIMMSHTQLISFFSSDISRISRISIEL